MSTPVIVSMWVDRSAAIDLLEDAARKERDQADRKVLRASAALYQHLNSGGRASMTAQEYVARSKELIEELEDVLREFTRSDGRARDLEDKAAEYRAANDAEEAARAQADGDDVDDGAYIAAAVAARDDMPPSPFD